MCSLQKFRFSEAQQALEAGVSGGDRQLSDGVLIVVKSIEQHFARLLKELGPKCRSFKVIDEDEQKLAGQYDSIKDCATIEALNKPFLNVGPSYYSGKVFI